MWKCSECKDNNQEQKAAKEAKLWKNMIDSLMQFTQTSTALMKGMQDKLGIPPEDTKQFNPCNVLEQIKEELKDIEVEKKLSNMCKCTASQTLEDEDPNSEAKTGIACYKEPKIIKKKKYRYSSDVESTLLAHKKRTPVCTCNKESYNFDVDSCLCKVIPERLKDEACPITVCSGVTRDEIQNVHCRGQIVEERIEDEKKEDGLLAWIPKAAYFCPDKFPQDDSHPCIIKVKDNFVVPNSLGYELWYAMKKYETNVAQIDESTSVKETYSQYSKKCVQVAMKLRSETTQQDIIGICTDNHVDSYVPYIAGLLNGNLVVAFDETPDKDRMVNCLKNVTPRIMFVGENSLMFLQECMQVAGLKFKIVIFGHSKESSIDSFQTYSNHEKINVESFDVRNTRNVESTCLICFSAGYSESKAVCLSHYAVLKQSWMMIDSQRALPVTLSYLQLHHITSLLVLFSAILQGAARIIVQNFEEYKVWALVKNYQVNTIHLYSHNFIELSESSEPKWDLQSLFHIFVTGERLRSSALKKLKELLLRTLISQPYEHTELAGLITMFDYSKPEDRIFNHFVNESCGRPINGVWYKVLDLETRKILPEMSPGELFIKSKLFRNGYFIGNKEEVCTKGDWISTGDYVSIDTYQCFTLINRIGDLIKFKKTIIAPSKLEDILLTHPMISEAVVYPIEDEKDGQHAAAAVAVRDSEDIYVKDLEDWMKIKVSKDEQLSGGLKIVSSIPYKSNGRIDKNKLY